MKDDPSGDHDHALLRRLAHGDEAALAALYDAWGQRVHALAHWMLGDPDEAEDVVEETFWQIWRTAMHYDAWRAPGAAWIMLIARSRALDRLRARRRTAARADALSAACGSFDGAAFAGVEDPGAHPERTELHAELVADGVEGCGGARGTAVDAPCDPPTARLWLAGCGRAHDCPGGGRRVCPGAAGSRPDASRPSRCRRAGVSGRRTIPGSSAPRR